jgi:hypothetical protein
MAEALILRGSEFRSDVVASLYATKDCGLESIYLLEESVDYLKGGK